MIMWHGLKQHCLHKTSSQVPGGNSAHRRKIAYDISYMD